jgi:hypothetical protein
MAGNRTEGAAIHGDLPGRGGVAAWNQLYRQTTRELMDEVERLDPKSKVLLRANLVLDIGAIVAAAEA